MKFAALCLVALACLPVGRVMAQNSVADASNHFGLDLYQKLRSQEGNLFLSPYSVDTALLMVEAGAGGQTAAEMQTVLHLPPMPADALDAAVGDLMASLQGDTSKNSYELRVANAIWAQKDFTFLPAYLDLLQTRYGAQANTADFADGAGTAKSINAWVAKQTNDRIKDLISPGDLHADMRLALIDAIYFKGDWKDPFEKAMTRDAPWHLDNGQTAAKPASMMHRRGSFDFYQDDRVSALEIPYAGDHLAMLALLPKGSLDDLETSLNADSLYQIIKQLHADEVDVAFPKFTMRSRFDLTAPLQEMGLKDAFNNDADFSGMDGRHDLAISQVVHAAFVQVDETGTEAAGATGITMRATAVMRADSFNADHPFLILIRDVKSGVILFIGRVADPTAQ